MTQNNLGNVLFVLDERENGTERLEQAVDAYRAALEVRTREGMPLDWAMTQANLGNVLLTLGKRRSEIGYLEQAMDAYLAALKVRTRGRTPPQLGIDAEQPRRRSPGIGRAEGRYRAS